MRILVSCGSITDSQGQFATTRPFIHFTKSRPSLGLSKKFLSSFADIFVEAI